RAVVRRMAKSAATRGTEDQELVAGRLSLPAEPSRLAGAREVLAGALERQRWSDTSRSAGAVGGAPGPPRPAPRRSPPPAGAGRGGRWRWASWSAGRGPRSVSGIMAAPIRAPDRSRPPSHPLPPPIAAGAPS